MSRTGYRPRRTRVYDCNYDAGERYYKSALDNLDKKQSGPSIVDRVNAGRANRAKSFDFIDNDEDLFGARRRAAKVINEDGPLDTRSGRFAAKTNAIEDDFDEQVQSSLSRMRANKKNLSNVLNDLDLDDSIVTVKRKARIDFGSKIDAADDDFSSSIRKRGEKARSEFNSIIDSTTLPAIEDLRSGATNRAKASKARLDDLENEMFERSEKQTARDKRSANLKKFLSDNEFDSESTTQAMRSITAKTEKRIINF